MYELADGREETQRRRTEERSRDLRPIDLKSREANRGVKRLKAEFGLSVLSSPEMGLSQ